MLNNLKIIQNSQIIHKLDLMSEFTHNLVADFFLSMKYRDQELIKSIITKVKYFNRSFIIKSINK
jgi:hypothetical protein